MVCVFARLQASSCAWNNKLSDNNSKLRLEFDQAVRDIASKLTLVYIHSLDKSLEAIQAKAATPQSPRNNYRSTAFF